MVKHEPDCMSIVNPTFGEGQTACTCGADLKPAPAPRCPHCGYTEGAIPSDFDAYAQANCEHRDSHDKPAPAPLSSDLICAWEVGE